jgi:hypothetical protein
VTKTDAALAASVGAERTSGLRRFQSRNPADDARYRHLPTKPIYLDLRIKLKAPTSHPRTTPVPQDIGTTPVHLVTLHSLHAAALHSCVPILQNEQLSIQRQGRSMASLALQITGYLPRAGINVS